MMDQAIRLSRVRTVKQDDTTPFAGNLWRFLVVQVLWPRLLPPGPVTAREAGRPTLWYPVGMGLSRLGGLFVYFVIFLMTGSMVLGSSDRFADILSVLLLPLFPLVIMLPSPLLWILPLSLSLAPLVVRERECGTWDLLRVTPYSTEYLLLAKMAGALWWMAGMINRLRSVILVYGLIVGGITLFFGTGIQEFSPPDRLREWALVYVPVGMIIFLFDRMQLFAVMVVAALAAGASSSSVRSALVRTLSAVFGALVLDMALVWLVLIVAVQPSLEYPLLSIIALISFGPPLVYRAELALIPALLAIFGTFAVRAVVFRLLWRYTVSAARTA